MPNSDINLPPWLSCDDPALKTESLVVQQPVADDVAVIVRALESGLPKNFASHLAGHSTAWLYDKRKNDLDFCALTDKAIAKGVHSRVLRINGHAKRNWQADAWMLARTHPREFAEPAVALSQEVNVSTGPTNIVVVGPERAAILVQRHATLRAEAIALVDKTNGNTESSH